MIPGASGNRSSGAGRAGPSKGAAFKVARLQVWARCWAIPVRSTGWSLLRNRGSRVKKIGGRKVGMNGRGGSGREACS